ncbi:MAG TPA: hypothetical protein VGC32_01955 [Solirubrobacterales bacterium]
MSGERAGSGEEPRAGSGEDPRIETLLRVNGELAAELRSLQDGRTQHARSAASPAARRLGRLLSAHDAVVAERDRLTGALFQSNSDLEDQRARLAAETERATKLDEERQRLVGKIAEYGELTDELNAEVERLRGGVGGLLRRGAARFTPSGRRSP